MSAFICGQNHFKALAIFAAERTGGYGWAHLRVDPRYIKGLSHPQAEARGLENLTMPELATLYADTLYRENVRSVRHRYPESGRDNLPGPIGDPGFIAIKARDTAHRFPVSPVDVLKMCDCLEYQSCETGDWNDTLACKLLGSIRKAAIRQLPGYDDAPWEYSREAS